MNEHEPLIKIRSDRFEVLQGARYVSVDRERVDAVHFHAGVLTVRYKVSGEVALDCTQTTANEVKDLLRVFQTQRDRNRKNARLTKARGDIGAILPGILG
ncbi:MAG: hypothetical protein F9K30_24035 [Dechloromonas sp.]|nr:MAG: hypothetical protein F9K30_24035 [Dechloromonas sp.]